MALSMICEKGHSYISPDIVMDWPEGAPICPECFVDWVENTQEGREWAVDHKDHHRGRQRILGGVRPQTLGIHVNDGSRAKSTLR